MHPYNQPKYQAQICHAVNYARANRRKVLWCIAQDWPLTAEESDLDPEKLQAMRESWLLHHDVQTSGIPGLFPFSAGMPVKFTDNVCREEKIFKHTSGRLKEIVLSEEATSSLDLESPERSHTRTHDENALSPATGFSWRCCGRSLSQVLGG